VLNCDKAKEVLGWTPEVQIDEGLEKTWRWLSSL
jgi:nucleoside-diphosphate-sugar epimerase